MFGRNVVRDFHDVDQDILDLSSGHRRPTFADRETRDTARGAAIVERRRDLP